MEVLDKLIEKRGFRKGQVVKLGYNDIVNLANQRVIKELEYIKYRITPREANVLEDRIKELKLKV